MEAVEIMSRICQGQRTRKSHLWRQRLRRAHKRNTILIATTAARQPEIRNPGVRDVFLRMGQQHVFRLDVAMNYPNGMEIPQSVYYLEKHALRVGLSLENPVFQNARQQIAAVEEFRDQEEGNSRIDVAGQYSPRLLLVR